MFGITPDGVNNFIQQATAPIAQQVNKYVTAINSLPADSPAPAPTPAAPAQSAAQIAAATQAAAQDKMRNYINDQVTGTTAGEMQSGNVAGSTYDSQGRDLAAQLTQGQTGINQARQGIAISQINSIKGLVDSIKSGLRGSAVNLGNSNALDSSAADAVGRIFSQYGNTQRNVINNDAAVKNSDQDVAQTNLGLQKDMGLRGLNVYKNTTLDQIANDTMQKLAALEGMGQLQGINGAVDINGIKQQVVNNAQQKIADADSYIQQLIGGINPTGADDIAKNAYALSNAGAAGSGNVGFTPLALNPASALGGAPTAQLPLYLKPKNG